jgi:hypothetical protein
VDPVPDPLLLRKSGSAGNRTRDLWPLDHRGGSILALIIIIIIIHVIITNILTRDFQMFKNSLVTWQITEFNIVSMREFKKCYYHFIFSRPRPLFRLGKRPPYKLDTRLCGTQGWSGRCEHKSHLSLLRIETRFLDRLVHILLVHFEGDI